MCIRDSFKGRDGCRTPMPWNAEPQAGFTTGEPWLPIPAAHRAQAVTRQELEPSSTLNATRAVLRWRKALPALQWGSIEFHDAPEPVLAFTRHHANQSLLVAFNLSANAAQWEIPDGLQLQALQGHGLLSGEIRDGNLHLPAHAVFFASLA